VIRPVARGRKEDKEEERAVHAWPIQEVSADEKEEDEDRGGIRRYEEERKPAVETH